jgi:uncharacterized protein with HEPN domain
MKKRDYTDYVEDIVTAIADIEQFVKGMEFKEFSKDKKTVFAVVRAIEIIGEAARQIPEPLKNNHTEVPWKEMMGIRNKIAHEYFGVDVEVIWNTVKENIPELKPLISKMLRDMS